MIEHERILRWGENGPEHIRAIIPMWPRSVTRKVFLLATKNPDTGEPFERPHVLELEGLSEEVPEEIFLKATACAVTAFGALAIAIVFINETRSRVAYFFWPISEVLTMTSVRTWVADLTEAEGVTFCGPFEESSEGFPVAPFLPIGLSPGGEA